MLAWPIDADNARRRMRTIEAHNGWVRALAVSPDGKTAGHAAATTTSSSSGPSPTASRSATFDRPRLPRLQRRLPSRRQVAGLRRPEGHRQGLGPGDRRASSASWTPRSCTSTTRPSGRHGGVRSMAFNADGTLLACAGITERAPTPSPASATRWSCCSTGRRGKQQAAAAAQGELPGDGWGVAFHPAGFIVGVGGGNGGMLWFWKPEQAQAVFTPEAAEQRPRPRPAPRRQAAGGSVLRRGGADVRHDGEGVTC